MAKIYEARDRIDDNAYVRYHAKIHQTEMLKCHKTLTDYARQTIKKLFNGPYGGAKPTTYKSMGNTEARV